MCCRVKGVLEKKCAALRPNLCSTGHGIADEFYVCIGNGKVDFHPLCKINQVVPRARLELARLSTPDPKSGASANFATSAGLF